MNEVYEWSFEILGRQRRPRFSDLGSANHVSLNSNHAVP